MPDPGRTRSEYAREFSNIVQANYSNSDIIQIALWASEMESLVTLGDVDALHDSDMED